MDGSGYPHGLRGDDILLEARVNYVPAKAGSFSVGWKPTKDHPQF